MGRRRAPRDQPPILILAPLAVAQQTAQEGQDIGIGIKQCADQADVIDGINITNHDRLHRFDASAFGGVVLDESSIIKHHDAKTFTRVDRGIPANAVQALRDSYPGTERLDGTWHACGISRRCITSGNACGVLHA